MKKINKIKSHNSRCNGTLFIEQKKDKDGKVTCIEKCSDCDYQKEKVEFGFLKERF